MFSEIELRDHNLSRADTTMRAFDRLAVKDVFVFVADRDPVAPGFSERNHNHGTATAASAIHR